MQDAGYYVLMIFTNLNDIHVFSGDFSIKIKKINFHIKIFLRGKKFQS